MKDTIDVELARRYTDAEGVEHKADDLVTLPRLEGKQLIRNGLARLPRGDAAAQPKKRTAGRKAAAKKTSSSQQLVENDPPADPEGNPPEGNSADLANAQNEE